MNNLLNMIPVILGLGVIGLVVYFFTRSFKKAAINEAKAKKVRELQMKKAKILTELKGKLPVHDAMEKHQEVSDLTVMIRELEDEIEVSLGLK